MPKRQQAQQRREQKRLQQQKQQLAQGQQERQEWRQVQRVFHHKRQETEPAGKQQEQSVSYWFLSLTS